MRVQATPNRIELSPGSASTVQVEVFNPSDLIVGYDIRAFGIDPSWVRIDGGDLSLFPETSGIVTVTVQAPAELPVGVRDLTIEITSRTPPVETQLVPIALDVVTDRRGAMEVVPGTLNGTSRGRFGLVVRNVGNAPVDFGFSGTDGEDALEFAFDPTYVTVGPGSQVDVAVEVKGRRPLVGNPLPRPFVVTGVGADTPISATGVFVQRPRFPRAAIGLLGLLAAIAVFAAVITAGLGQVVDESKEDSDLALAIVESQQRGENGPPGELTGTVRDLSTGERVTGLTVGVAPADNPVTAVATTATDDGAFSFSGLRPGDYLLRFSGAGFSEQWFPGVPTVGDAEPVTIISQDTVTLDLALSALPGRIRGRVIAAEPDGATVTAAVASQELADVAETDLAAGGSVVQTSAVSEDGVFDFIGLPSPFEYVIEVSKDGFASQRRQVAVGPGEFIDEVRIPLRRGDGEIQGTVLGLDAGNGTTSPIGNATVTATDGDTFLTTSTLTTGSGDLAEGDFVLRNLPSPATYAVSVEAEGFGTETFTVSLTDGAPAATGRTVTLRPADGVIQGSVTSADGPLGGVLVEASDGQAVYRTTTASSDGSYELSGLPVPGSYTVSFSRDGYATTSRAIALDAFQNQRATATVRMTATSGSVVGTVGVRERGEAGPSPAGGVTVTMTSGATTLTTTTAHLPAGSLGRYRFADVPTGTYSITFSRDGSLPVVLRATVEADGTTTVDADLEPRAALVGIAVETADGSVVPGARIRLYRTSEFPATVLATTTSGADGVFEFEDLDGPERYTVTAARTDTGQEVASGNINLGPGEERRFDRSPGDPLTLRLPTSTGPTTTISLKASLTGLVLLDGGTQQGASITIRDSQNVLVQSTLSDASGEFEVDDLDPDTYAVRVTFGGNELNSVVTLAEGESRQYDESDPSDPLTFRFSTA